MSSGGRSAHIAGMRTLDMPYLHTHPEGDEKAVFTISAKIPEQFNVALNRDGSRPEVSLAVTSTTYGTALAVLQGLNDQADELAFSWLYKVLTDDQIAALNALQEESDLPDFAREAFSRQGEEFLTFSTDVDSTVTETYKDGTQEVESPETTTITITAPSIAIGMKAFDTLTSSRYLQKLAISFSPEESDGDDGDTNEVLVRP